MFPNAIPADSIARAPRCAAPDSASRKTSRALTVGAAGLCAGSAFAARRAGAGLGARGAGSASSSVPPSRPASIRITSAALRDSVCTFANASTRSIRSSGMRMGIGFDATARPPSLYTPTPPCIHPICIHTPALYTPARLSRIAARDREFAATVGPALSPALYGSPLRACSAHRRRAILRVWFWGHWGLPLRGWKGEGRGVAQFPPPASHRPRVRA